VHRVLAEIGIAQGQRVLAEFTGQVHGHLLGRSEAEIELGNVPGCRSAR
jgi:hypothetical protein